MATERINGTTQIKNREVKVERVKTNKEGYAAEITLSWRGIKITFREQRNKPKRIDLDSSCIPWVPTEIYQKMVKCAGNILGRKRTNNKSIVLIKPIRADQIREANLREWLYCLEAAGIKILENGRIRINYWVKKPGQPPRNEPRTLPDIHIAIRQQTHILENYQENINGRIGELNKIYSVESLISRVNHLLRNWTLLDSAAKAEINAELIAALSLLGRCRCETKIQAKEKIVELISLRDKLGRINPGAMAAKTISALNFIARRLGEINTAAPAVALRKELLILENRRLWANMRKCKGALEFILQKHFPNNKKITLAKNKRDFIEMSIGQALYHLNEIWCSPYYEQGITIKNLIKTAKKNILIGNFSRTAGYLKMAVYTITVTLKENRNY